MATERYNAREVEARWQKVWNDKDVFVTIMIRVETQCAPANKCGTDRGDPCAVADVSKQHAAVS